MPNKPGGDTMEPGITQDTPQFREIVAAAAPVVWVKKKPSEYRKFPIFDQGNSGSCVAQTGKKMLGVYVWTKEGVFIPLSASHIYQRRSNRPGSGMIGINCFEIMQQGVTLSVLAPDEKLSDAQMDAVKVSDFDMHVAQPFKSGKPIVLPTKDIEAIASVIQATGKAVMVWFYFTGAEWTARPVIKNTGLVLGAPQALHHSVAAVDFTLTDDGKKALVIDDSWGPNAGNGAGQRLIDEDFFKVRNWFSAYFMNFAFEEGAPTPPIFPHTFTKSLEFIPLDAQGQISNPAKHDAQKQDVAIMQDILRKDGVFPANVSSTGYFGAVTKDAVQKYQLKHGIVANSSDPGFGFVGPKTRAYLNTHQ